MLRERGNAFVDAWLVLRSEIDALCATGAHPALADAWIGALPESVVLDMSRIATEPRALLAVAGRLAASGTPAGRAQVVRLQDQMTWPGMVERLIEIRARAGDALLLRDLRAQLGSEAKVVRLHAAARLACAGQSQGLILLRQTLDSKHVGEVEPAARALGRCGGAEDVDRLRRLVRARPKEPFALAALGELLTRTFFPWHHAEITRRDAAFVHDSAPGGTLDTWFASLGKVVEQGTQRSASVPTALLSLRRDGPIFEPDLEVFVRRLSSLSEMWAAIEGAMAATPPVPQWPRDFSSALVALAAVPPSLETAAVRERRISSAVAVLHTLASQLGYGAAGALSVKALTPGLERALDHNFATTTRLFSGQSVVLAWDTPVKVVSLQISTSCGSVSGSEMAGVRLRWRGPDQSSAISATLDPEARYFQVVSLPGFRLNRLEIEVEKTKGDGPACIAELELR